jgi:hypothetical protein
MIGDAEQPGSTGESLQFGAHGVLISTWAELRSGGLRLGLGVLDQDSMMPDRTASLVKDGSVSAFFSGELRHNPSFLYDSRDVMDVLVTIGSEHAPSDFASAIQLTECLETVTRAVAEVGQAPILFLQAPAAPHNDPSGSQRGDGSGERPRVGQALAVRMAIGLDPTDAATRVRMMRFLQAFCLGHGYGLQVSDRRLGRVRGEWWTLATPDPAEASTHRQYLAQEMADRTLPNSGFRGDRIVSEVLAVSIIGPARTGSSLAVLADFQARNIVVQAASITALHEVAFLNFLVAVAPALEGEPLTSGAHPVVDGLGELARLAALTPQRGSRERRSQLTKALDYLYARSGPYRVTDSPRGVAVWMRWYSPRLEVDPVQIAIDYFAKLPLVESVQLTYRQTRLSTDGTSLRGRASMSISIRESAGQTPSAAWLSERCSDVENVIADALAARTDGTRVRVDWRERWLRGTSRGLV